MPGERKDEGNPAERTLTHDAETDREYTTPARRDDLEREPPGPPEPGRAGDFRRDATGKDRIASPPQPSAGAEEDAAARREDDEPPAHDR